jgi:hypothetical protein
MKTKNEELLEFGKMPETDCLLAIFNDTVKIAVYGDIKYIKLSEALDTLEKLGNYANLNGNSTETFLGSKNSISGVDTKGSKKSILSNDRYSNYSQGNLIGV